MRRRLLTTTLTVALSAGAVGAVLPAAAQAKIVTLTLLNGIKIQLPLPDGTPLDQLQLPALNSPVVSLSLGNPTVPTTAGAPLPGQPGAPITLPAGPALAAPIVGASGAQTTTGAKKSAPAKPGATFGTPVNTPANPVATPFRAASGIPLPANPTLSLVPLGAVPLGVPNFFIDTFRIPPFLIPIYQAAGTEYDTPWQVLAAINDIETDYGRNLSVSSAGAVGWMQFLPATWKQYGVDANGDGVKDPYNPVDAIFAAARFLHAAGASQNLRRAIFAYNNANWYVDSVLLRAKLVGGMPSELVSSLTGLTDGLFPVHAAARYADDVIETAALARQARAQNTPAPLTATAKHTSINVYAKAGSPVVAVKDGIISGLGSSAALGSYIKLRDASGNTYVYSQLKKISDLYAEPKAKTESAAQAARDVKLPHDPTPQAPASAGHQPAVPPAAAASGAASQAIPAPAAPHLATDTPAGPQRLFAHPARRAASAAGGHSQAAAASSFDLSSYFVQSYGLKRADVDLKPLTTGSHVIAGAILGRIGVTAPSQASHLGFQIRPAGKGTPLIDPKPILDGWKLLEATSIYRAAALNPISGVNPTIGQVLLESKAQLQQQVLADPAINIYSCGRRDIEAGLIDQRVLATLEFLSASGIKPTVTALRCGNSLAGTAFDKTGNLSDNASGTGVDISAINGIPVLGHQGAGSITDIAIRRLLTLQGSFKPASIDSLMSYPLTDNTFAMSDHANRVHIGFATLYDPRSKFGHLVNAALKPAQWLRLITRLGQIQNPSVAAAPSTAAIPVAAGN